MTTIEAASPEPPMAPTADLAGYQRAAARIHRRQDRLHLSQAIIIPIIGGLLVLIADAQALALIPLQGSMAATYGLTASQAAWTLSATSIATAATVPSLTRMGDRYGLRRMLLVSLTFVTVGQLLCSMAGDFALLVIGRSVLGISAAVAIVYTLIRETSKNSHEVNRATGFLTSATGLGIGVSYLFGGAILRLNGTISTFFWILTALSGLLLLLTWLFVADSPLRTKSSVDWVGGLLLGAFLVAIVLAVSQGNDWGWDSGTIRALFGAGLLGAACWTIWELKATAPMFDIRLVARRTVWPAALIFGLTTALGVFNSLIVSSFVQTPEVAGYGMTATPLMAGVYLLPISVPIACGGFLAARIIRASGARRVLLLGSVVIVVNEVWFAYHHSTLVEILVGTFVFGCAYSITSTAAIGSLMSGARRGESGMLSSISFLTLTVGAAVAPAIFAAALTASFVFIPGTQIPVPAAGNYETGLLYASVIAGVSLVAALVVKIPVFSDKFTEDAVMLTGDEPDASRSGRLH